LGRALALALVEADSPGEGLAVEIRGKARGVSVTDLPFYVRQRHLADGQGS
jgi:glycine cleavage system aminomethyltransferase T